MDNYGGDLNISMSALTGYRNRLPGADGAPDYNRNGYYSIVARVRLSIVHTYQS